MWNVFLAPLTLPSAGPIVYKSVRVAAVATMPMSLTIPNDLVIGGLGGQTGSLVVVSTDGAYVGNLRTEGQGTLVMQTTNSYLTVNGDASFAGGSTVGLLTNGGLTVNGNFTQAGASGGQFAATGSHRVSFTRSTGTQTIQFQDTVGSYFNYLTLNRTAADTVRLRSNALVTDTAVLSGRTLLTSAGPEAMKLPFGGVLWLPDSLAVLAPRRVEFGTITLGFPSNGAARVRPDTAVFLNAGTFPSGTAYDLRSIRVAGGTLTSMGSHVVKGNMVISGGAYRVDTYATDSIAGSLRTEGSGKLYMLNSGFSMAPTLAVRDSALFAGGISDSLLAGALRIYGSFRQAYGSINGATFQASGSHTTLFAGTAGQSITFANPAQGATGSHFNALQITNVSSGGVSLQSNVFANAQLQDGSTVAQEQLFGNGNTLTVGGTNIWHFQFNNAPLVIDTTALFTRMDTVTFTGYASNATILQVRGGPGLSIPRTSMTFWGLTFPSTPPATGYYVDARQMKSGTPAFSVNLYSTSPALASNGGRTITTLGPGGTAALTWSP